MSEDLIRTHLSAKEIKTLRPAKLKPDGEPHLKPPGFWYEVNDSWFEWCKVEMPHWVGLADPSTKGKKLPRDRQPYTLRYWVSVQEANLLYISDTTQFDEFVRIYGYDRLDSARFMGRPDYIDWIEVANAGYDGVEISPYLWERRLEGGLWYYGWDVASGVVWNPKNIKIKLLGTI
jgi:hypothetical protein